jgi:outer membrane receptor protein involved in Fe transport
VSYTTTAGFVYSPSWLPRFRMSVDYYNLDMTNVISSINGANSQILAQCQASNNTSPVCSSIIRSTPTAFPTYVTNYSANLAQVYTHGIDFEASYNFMLGDVIKDAPGRFDLRLLYSYQPVLNSVNNPGAPTIQLAGVAGMSADRVTTDVTYRVGPVSIDYEMRWLSSQNLSGTPLLVYAGPPLPAIFYHDINLTYRFHTLGHDGQVFFVVDNLLNQYPRISPSTSFSAIPGFGSPYVTGDDPIGRYFTLGFRAQY